MSRQTQALVVLVLLFFQFSEANDLSYKKKIALITSATSKSELKSISKKLGQYEEIKEECRFELQTSKLPTKCFKQVEMEHTLRLYPQLKLAEAKKVLIQICDFRVLEMADVSQMQKSVFELDPRLECAKKLKERIQRHKYQNVESTPLTLFESTYERL